jgi:hypothetical protein
VKQDHAIARSNALICESSRRINPKSVAGLADKQKAVRRFQLRLKIHRRRLKKLGSGVFEIITAIHDAGVFGIVASQEANERHGWDFAEEAKLRAT